MAPRQPWLDRWSARQFQRAGLRLAGAGLLAATGAIHLDLYLTGYRSIPTIGWLFLLQVSAVFSIAAAVLVTGSRLIAAGGAALALATLGAYLNAIWAGLFGFKEIRSTPGIVAGVVEVAAFAALAALATTTPAGSGRPVGQATVRRRLLAIRQGGIPGAGRAVASICLAALAVFGFSLARASGQARAPANGRAVLKVATISGVRVLTNASGLTLYWFAADTPTRSNCNGMCAMYWPPVTGVPAAGPGVTGRLGVIKRSDGANQVTYDGQPLYTYVGDTAPGSAFGNNLNIDGGLWHTATVSG